MAKDIRSRTLQEDIPATVYVDSAQASRPPTGTYIVWGAIRGRRPANLRLQPTVAGAIRSRRD
jgi:hypothetical protein